MQADGLFEAALGLLLIGGSAAGWLDGSDFPAPVGKPLIVAFGGLLVVVGAILWRLARDPNPRLLRALAAANLTTAAAAIAWLLFAEGFSTSGSALTLATVIALVALATAQLHAVR